MDARVKPGHDVGGLKNRCPGQAGVRRLGPA